MELQWRPIEDQRERTCLMAAIHPVHIGVEYPACLHVLVPGIASCP